LKQQNPFFVDNLKGTTMRTAATFFAVAFLAITPAIAADGHKPNYGGVVMEIGHIQYELVAQADSISIYVEDHGKKIDTKGATAKVTLLTGKEKSEATLAPAGGNKLLSSGTFNVKPGTKAVAVVTLAGKAPATARFVIP